MERKVGERFSYNGELYEVQLENIACIGCDFINCCRETQHLRGECQDQKRSDYNAVIFKKIKNTMDKSSDFDGIIDEIKDLHARKNKDYGSSFDELWSEFGIGIAKMHLTEKFKRFKQLSDCTAMVKEESIEDTLLDMASYAIMTVEQIRKGRML